MMYISTTLAGFRLAFEKAEESNPLIRTMCSSVSHLNGLTGLRMFVSSDYLSGFCIHPDGELTHVFSAVKGRGKYLIECAKMVGARKLGCFDGYLTEFYTSMGFEEYNREPNWTQGEPDVVFMQLKN